MMIKQFVILSLLLLITACNGGSSNQPPTATAPKSIPTTTSTQTVIEPNQSDASSEVASEGEQNESNEVVGEAANEEGQTIEVAITVVNEDTSTILVQFEQELEPRTASDRASYKVNGAVPDRARYDVAKRQTILIVGEPLKRGVKYIIDVNGAQDLSSPPNTIIAQATLSISAAIAEALPTEAPAPSTDRLEVIVDTTANLHPISPYIYGMAGADAEYVKNTGVTLHRWGGNANTRYNWKLGNAWNTASDWFYTNVNYGDWQTSASDNLIQESKALGIAPLLTIPTIGWVAKDNSSCSFPLPDGTCGNAEEATCEKPGQIADPRDTSIEAPPEFMVEWVNHLKEQGGELPFLAMDNESDLWGVTHYDIHPDCTGYDEMYERFVMYAAPIKAASPESELLGPVSCCWWFYWNSMLGPADKEAHDGMDFLPWYLQQMAAYEAETGQRLLDVLDIHYYPAGLYNDDASPEKAAHRTRSTRSLWDPRYSDESWINEPIYLIPRMNKLIETYYPGTKLAISEWNWGAEETMNGAVTIADVLGIFGREELHLAAYWRYPEPQTPGYYAFKMFGNYDDAGSRFGDTSVNAQSSNPDAVGSYASLDSQTGKLHIMLINKLPDQAVTLPVEIKNFNPQGITMQYRYDEQNPNQIVSSEVDISETLEMELPPYSITLLVLEGLAQ